MQFIVIFAQGIGYAIVIMGSLLCLSGLITSLRTMARSEDAGGDLVIPSGLLWYGVGPLAFVGIYTVACLIATLASMTSWWILPGGLVICSLPLVVTGLKGRARCANKTVRIRRM